MPEQIMDRRYIEKALLQVKRNKGASGLNGLPKTWKQLSVQQLLSAYFRASSIVDEEESILLTDNPQEAWKKVLHTLKSFVQ